VPAFKHFSTSFKNLAPPSGLDHVANRHISKCALLQDDKTMPTITAKTNKLLILLLANISTRKLLHIVTMV